jgi:hypothetical protein
MTEMPFVLWTIIALIGYVAGQVILVRVTPRILVQSFDEGIFMAYATAEIFGGLFVFGAVAVTFGLYNGILGIKLLDFLLLAGIVIVCASLLLKNFRAFRPGVVRSSRMVISLYCLLLALAALYYIVVLLTF